MTNYLIMRKGVLEHYFFRAYEGICVRKRRSNGIWQEHTNVFERGKDGFGLYVDNEGVVHIICTDNENKLIYGVCEKEEWKKYVISKLNNDIFVSQIKLYSIRDRLNLMYSALYNGENLLVHCVLGDRAKPSTVDIMEDLHFCILEENVYYTNLNGNLGYVSLSDEKPSVFNSLYEDAHTGSAYKFEDKTKILFTRDKKLFLDGKELANDSLLETPIIMLGNDMFYVMWKSGGFIRYIRSKNGTTFSEPMRFMSTGSIMSIYTVQKENLFYDFYGSQSANEIILLGNPNIFETTVNYHAPKQSELQKIRDMLNETRDDVNDTKKELERLGKLISGLSERK